MPLSRGVPIFVSAAVLASCVAHSSVADEAAPAYSARVINPKLLGATADPVRGVYVIWGTDGTILRSGDGERWENSHTRGHWLAVGAAGTAIRSTDGARNWQQVATPGPAADLRVVLFDAASGAWLAAGSNGTLLRSVDGGVVAANRGSVPR